jgi:uncharacterized lipoprotein YmbA
MRTPVPAAVVLAGLALVAVGCVSLKRSPEARFFVLQSEINPGATPSSGNAPEGIVGLENVLLPGHLMRPQLVTWQGPGELAVDEFLRWAEPLEDGVSRTLGEDLAGLLPHYQIVRRPWRGDTRTRCRVEVVLEMFGLQRDGKVVLQGRFRLLPDKGELAFVQQPVRLERGPLTGGAEREAATGVDAMSGLIADLSREIAQAIQALPPEDEEHQAAVEKTREP